MSRHKGSIPGFHTIGELAEALGRKSVTLRKWEADGHLPPTSYRTPSEDARGCQRLYSTSQVKGLVRIAAEEGLLDGRYARLGDTDFAARAAELFRQLAEAPRPEPESVRSTTTMFAYTKTDPAQLASAIAHAHAEHDVVIRAIGARAVAQAVKATVIARRLVDSDLCLCPDFMGEDSVSALELRVLVSPSG